MTSEFAINCNCLKSFTLDPPEDEPFRVRAGSFTVVSADYQGVDADKWVIKAGRLLGSKKDKQCAGIEMTSGRSLVKVDSKNDEHGTYTVSNQCAWKSKFIHHGEDIQYGSTQTNNFYCLGVREPNDGDHRTTFALDPRYLIWNKKSGGECENFYITAAYDNERHMFNIFYEQNKRFYSPSCCVIANDNVNIPGVDDGLTMCQCVDKRDINIIKGKPVIKKGLLGRFKKLFH